MEMTCQLRLILKMSKNGPTLCVPFFNFMVSSTICESSGHRVDASLGSVKVTVSPK